MTRSWIAVCCVLMLGAARAAEENVAARVAAGQAAAKAGQYAEARQQLAAALALDPLNKEARKANSKVCAEVFGASFAACLLRAEEESKAGHGLAAMAALREILSVDPDHKEALGRQRTLAARTLDAANAAFDRALALSDQKKDPEAIEEYRKAALLKPGFIEAINNLGQLYFLNGQYNDALAVFSEAFAVDPKDPIVLNNLASTHDALGHYEDAIHLWKEFLGRSKDPMLVPEAEENILVAEGRLLRNRLRQEPDNADVHVALIDNLVRQKKWERARQELARSRQHAWDERTKARLDELEKRLTAAEAEAAKRRPER